MTIGDAAAAEAFQALSNAEKSERVEEFAERIKNTQWDLKYMLHRDVLRYAEVLLRLGLHEKYCALSEKQRGKFFAKFFDDETAETLFTLNDLCPGVVSEVFATSSLISFEDFSRYYRRTFPWIIHGSNDFINALWRLFVEHGDPDFWSADRKPLEKGASGEIDQLLTQSVVILKGAYGEEKVQYLIERMIQETPISALDLIRLVKSDLDISTMPLIWATQLVNSEVRTEHESVV